MSAGGGELSRPETALAPALLEAARLTDHELWSTEVLTGSLLYRGSPDPDLTGRWGGPMHRMTFGMLAGGLLVACGGGSASAPVVQVVAPDGGSTGPGSPDAGPGPGTTNPCGSVPIEGVCTSPTTVSYCLVPTGSDNLSVKDLTCASGETCALRGARATCVLTASCREGSTRCDSATPGQLQTCSAGTWASSPCANGCTASALGAFCAPLAPGNTTTLTGNLAFEAYPPNSGRTDWSTNPVAYGARGFLVFSRYPDPAAPGKFIPLDAVYTADRTVPTTGPNAGDFAIKIRSSAGPTTGDQLVFAAAAADPGGDQITYCVADPSFPAPGKQGVYTTGPTPRLWSWSTGVTSSAPLALTIRASNGSGAANVFDWLQSAYKYGRGLHGQTGVSVVGWVGMGTSWSCGSCFAPYPASVFNQLFGSQIWYGGDDQNQEYWADAVTAHEVGHWMMESYGTSPGEGGPHVLGVPTFPGQAWSEGWATFFSSDLRQDTIYLDKQGGTMFWFDLTARSYAGATWQRPAPAGGLLQKMDENEVAADLWALATQFGSPAAPDSARIHAALASAHLTVPPFKRGYTRHTWTLAPPATFTNVHDTGNTAPFLGDALDALLCAGASQAGVDGAMQPATYFPYPSGSPLCP